MSDSFDELGIGPENAAVMAEWKQWKSTLKKCIGYDGGCDGDLVGLEHSDNCPLKGERFATHLDAFKAGFVEMKSMDSRCLKTGNPVGTDTWMVGWVCPCAACQLYVKELAKEKNAQQDQSGIAGDQRSGVCESLPVSDVQTNSAPVDVSVGGPLSARQFYEIWRKKIICVCSSLRCISSGA